MAIHGEGIEIREPPRNLWRDAVIGMAAGVVGTMAMGRFWGVMSSLASNGEDRADEVDDGSGADRHPDDPDRQPRATTSNDERRLAEAAGSEDDEGPLDDIALVGPFHREEESSPETLARVGYAKLRGHEPSDETRKTLASEIHWATGMGLGLIYGLVRGASDDGLDLGGGLLFGAGAWFVNDELLVPMLGLSKGPTAHELSVHAQALGAHVVYGLATAATAQVLDRVL